jgi:hypothetical protein
VADLVRGGDRRFDLSGFALAPLLANERRPDGERMVI